MPQQQTDQSDPTSSQADPSTDFGANEWLVEEMYEQFLADAFEAWDGPGAATGMWRGQNLAGVAEPAVGRWGRRRNRAAGQPVG